MVTDPAPGSKRAWVLGQDGERVSRHARDMLSPERREGRDLEGTDPRATGQDMNLTALVNGELRDGIGEKVVGEGECISELGFRHGPAANVEAVVGCVREEVEARVCVAEGYATKLENGTSVVD